MRLIVANTKEAAASIVADAVVAAIRAKPNALLGLASGGTVEELYRQLARRNRAGEVDFSAARTVNMDEYAGLSAGDEQSFACFMDRQLFSKTNFDKRHIFLLNGAGDPAAELERFDAFLRGNPIDFQILGIGDNGHIGFNEPESYFKERPHEVELAQQTIQANARFFKSAADVPETAWTMGVRDVARAQRVVLMAFGAKKAGAIRRLFADDHIDPRLPCSIIKLCRDATVVVDKELAQAAGLKETTDA